MKYKHKSISTILKKVTKSVLKNKKSLNKFNSLQKKENKKSTSKLDKLHINSYNGIVKKEAIHIFQTKKNKIKNQTNINIIKINNIKNKDYNIKKYK